MFEVAKINKKKTRIKLNETLNSQLDAMEDNSSLEVFAPKNSAQLEFYDMVNEAIEKEELLAVENNKKNKNKKNKKVKIDSVTQSSMESSSLLITLLLFALFGIFVFAVWQIMF